MVSTCKVCIGCMGVAVFVAPILVHIDLHASKQKAKDKLTLKTRPPMG